MGVLVPPPPPPPVWWPLLLKTSAVSFWALLIVGVMWFGFAVFIFTLALRLLLDEWSSLSRRWRSVSAVFFVLVALLLILAFVGFVIALGKEAGIIWK